MKAVIAAAGYGTRMLPITKAISKEMLPVWTKPVIHYIVEDISNAGLKDILMIVSDGKEDIQKYFTKNFELEYQLEKKWKLEKLNELKNIQNLANIAYVYQKQQLWFAHALLSVKNLISEDYFLLSVGDTIFSKWLFEEILQVHKQTNKPVIALKEIPYEQVSQYWVVKIKDNKIVWFVEKPSVDEAPSNLIIVWVYILPRKILEIIEKLPINSKTGEIMLTEAFEELIKTQDIIPYITKTKIYDTWNPESWLKANLELNS